MIFDIESDGLELQDVTKIHCMAYKPTGSSTVKVTSSYETMRKLLLEAKELIGHNIILYDIPVLEKILGIKIKAKLTDTLGLSWYLFPKRNLHGLETYGDECGIEKPEITDWQNLSPDEYKHRCVEDVKINNYVWKIEREKLMKIYSNKQDAKRIASYLSYKLLVIQEQHRSQWKLDRELATTTLDALLLEQDKKIVELSTHMPKVPVYVDKKRPAKPYLKNGGLSAKGREWDSFLKSRGLSEQHSEPVRYIASYKEPNPNSTDQVKDWLTSLGWEPENFKYVKDGDKERAIPQLRIEGEEGKELCPSIVRMFEKYPFLELLEGLTVIQHRAGILKGFLDNERDGFLKATMLGFTNTLRLKHRVIVNLPGVYKPYGKQVRGSLIARDGNILCGSDMSSLEDNTKKHYMYPYDPDYVNEMSSPTFDPHLDLAKFAKKVAQEDIDFYVEFKKLSKAKDFVPTTEDKERYKRVDIIRKTYKVANYACIYGVGAPKLARSADLTLKEAKKLIEVYWQRNWSIKQFSEDAEVITIDGEMWVYNPVSKFWYSLRNRKDIFSTINQSTGVFCFDSWIREFRRLSPQMTAQFHDEIVKEIMMAMQDVCRDELQQAITTVNNKLKLNVTLRIDIQFGKSYADIH